MTARNAFRFMFGSAKFRIITGCPYSRFQQPTSADSFRGKHVNQTLERDVSVKNDRTISRKRVWAGRILSGLAVLFFLVDGAMKLWKPAVVVEATRQLGYPESAITGIGLLLLACTLLYVYPPTAIAGAILLTGYLGGAVASQVRVGAGWFNVVFPLIFGVLIWGGLSLRDSRVRTLLT